VQPSQTPQKLSETRLAEENGQARYRNQEQEARKDAAQRRVMEPWGRTMASKGFNSCPESGQRNNAESIEVGRATPLGLVTVV